MQSSTQQQGTAQMRQDPGGGGEGRATRRHTENFEYSFFEFRFDIPSEFRIRNPNPTTVADNQSTTAISTGRSLDGGKSFREL